jgi:uncharacterized RDD family membrane protein YckC
VSNPYDPPRKESQGTPSSPKQETGARRSAAWAIDAGPAVVAVLFVTLPVLLLSVALMGDSWAGTGFFDPTVGGDPLLKRLPAQPVAALFFAAWLVAETVVLAIGRRSIGKWILGLHIATLDGKTPSPARAFGREALRGGLAGGLVLMGVFGPRFLRIDAGAFYAPQSLTGGLGPHPTAVATSILALAALLAAHFLADLTLVVASAPRRSLADRLAGTRVASMGTQDRPVVGTSNPAN